MKNAKFRVSSQNTMKFTEKQGQYLAFIYNYSQIAGRPPAETDLQRFFLVSPPTVHQMILRLEENGLISRTPGQARSIQLLVSPEELPILRRTDPPPIKRTSLTLSADEIVAAIRKGRER